MTFIFGRISFDRLYAIILCLTFLLGKFSVCTGSYHDSF